MRESTFTLLFLPLFILAFVPGLLNYALIFPSVLLTKLAGSWWAALSPSTSAVPSSSLYACHCCSSYGHQVAADSSSAVPCTAQGPSSSSSSSSSPSVAAGQTSGSMSWFQKTLTLPSRSRGSYLITSEVESQLPEIRGYRVGVVHLFLQHTSAALSLNENWDEDVRADMSDALDRIAPESTKGNRLYRHDAEGADDMPAHVKSALVGASVSVPITDGRLNTGTWQGIWFLEFRKAKHSRRVVATIQGEKM